MFQRKLLNRTQIWNKNGLNWFGSVSAHAVGDPQHSMVNDVYYSRFTSLPDANNFEYPHYISKRHHPTVWTNNIDTDIQRLKNKHDINISRNDIEFYDKHGYLILNNFFDDHTIKDVKNTLTDYMDKLNIDNTNEYVLTETKTSKIRSIFNIHDNLYKSLWNDVRLTNIVSTILNSDIYITQSRINLQQELHGEGFYWHSDFETWHIEDGMKLPRSLSAVILIDDGYPYNGGLMVIPGSHKFYIHCINQDSNDMPNENWLTSLKNQYYGTPTKEQLLFLYNYNIDVLNGNGIEYIGVGKSGTVILFDSNLIHGSHNNISPKSRNNIFMVYNSVDNKLGKPIIGNGRPSYIAERKNVKGIIYGK